jgi:hypothetical protein
MKKRKKSGPLDLERLAMTLTSIGLVEAKRKHAYQILQGTAGLSLADCQFYEDSVHRWIAERRAFTAYEISYAVNGELIQAEGVALRHAVTGDAVHVLLSIYTEAAGYTSELINLGGGRMPRLYYPDEAGRQEWMSARMPTTPGAMDKILRARSPRGKRKGKPGRPPQRVELAKFAIVRHRRTPPMTWADIAVAWQIAHPNDHVTVEMVRSAARRWNGRLNSRRAK